MIPPLPLVDWAARHGVPAAALADLLHVMGVARDAAPAPDLNKTREGYVQSVVRLEAPRHGVWLTRNNVGALKDENGRVVRYGLANESHKQNEVLKSGDLIGVRAVRITPAHVGTTIGQFVSRECKHATWKWGEDLERETAQLAWATLITSYGGDAQFVTGEGSFQV